MTQWEDAGLVTKRHKCIGVGMMPFSLYKPQKYTNKTWECNIYH